MDYAFLRINILVSQSIKWQQDGENITILPIILSLQNIYANTSNITAIVHSWPY